MDDLSRELTYLSFQSLVEIGRVSLYHFSVTWTFTDGKSFLLYRRGIET